MVGIETCALQPDAGLISVITPYSVGTFATLRWPPCSSNGLPGVTFARLVCPLWAVLRAGSPAKEFGSDGSYNRY